MKLLHCTNCGDVLALMPYPRKCFCHLSGGHYQDDVNVKVSGKAVVIGVSTEAFVDAVNLEGSFTGFVISQSDETVRR